MSPQSDWVRLAKRLDLPADAFGDWAATDGMLEAAKRAAEARTDMALIEAALRSLSKCSRPYADIIDTLRTERTACMHRLAAFPRKGPQNLAAHLVAAKVARAFTEAGRAVTYGQAPDGESPSTPYCRAVAIAFEVLGIEGGWRGPSRAAWVEWRDRAK